MAGAETMDGWRSADEIRALCDAATPGPWFVASREGDDEGWWIWADRDEPFTVALLAYDGPDDRTDGERELADAAFIAAARELVPSLLAEVEAAHRFEQSAAVDSARLAAVEALIEQARKVSPSASMTVYVGDLEVALGRRPDSVRGIVGQHDVAAADAPQPAEPMTLSCVPTGCQCSCHRSGGLQSAHIVACCNPSPAQPADPPTKETQR